MKKIFGFLCGPGLLILPLGLLAQDLPPPGGPYPSTVTPDESRSVTPDAGQLRFPPPDLIASEPPPPSLSEELGPDFKASAPADQPPVSPAASAPGAPAYAPAHEAAVPAYGGSDYRYPAPPAATPSADGQQWPGGYAQPGWPASQPGAGYPGYGYAYPYGYAAPGGYSAPAYGYGYPGYGNDSSNNWNESMPTPFGTMPGPWDSMPKSFFPGR